MKLKSILVTFTFLLLVGSVTFGQGFTGWTIDNESRETICLDAATNNDFTFDAALTTSIFYEQPLSAVTVISLDENMSFIQSDAEPGGSLVLKLPLYESNDFTMDFYTISNYKEDSETFNPGFILTDFKL